MSASALTLVRLIKQKWIAAVGSPSESDVRETMFVGKLTSLNQTDRADRFLFEKGDAVLRDRAIGCSSTADFDKVAKVDGGAYLPASIGQKLMGGKNSL